MQFLGEECSACCTAGDFTLVSARDDRDDDESSFFRLGTTLFQMPHVVKRKVRGRGATVALRIRMAVQPLFRGAIYANRIRRHPLKSMFPRSFMFKTSSENYRIFFHPKLFQPQNFALRETSVFHQPTRALLRQCALV